MSYCFHCGKELPEGSGFCPACGHSVEGYQYPPVEAEPVKPKADGGVKGRSIASIILGGEGIGFGIVTIFYLLIQGLMFLVIHVSGEGPELAVLPAVMYLYIFIFSAFSLGLCIAGKILAGQALKKLPDYRLPKIGRILCVIGIIITSVVLVLGLFPLLVLLS